MECRSEPVVTGPRGLSVPVQLMLPRAAAERIRAGGSYGYLVGRVSLAEQVAAIDGVSTESGGVLPFPLTPKTHFLNSCDRVRNGIWRRANPELHILHYEAAIRRTAITRDAFAATLDRALPSGAAGYPVISYAPAAPDPFPDLCAWWVLPDGVQPIDLETEPAELGIAALAPGWPWPRCSNGGRFWSGWGASVRQRRTPWPSTASAH